jgi:V/A-type H+-transporting ATPase subunit I
VVQGFSIFDFRETEQSKIRNQKSKIGNGRIAVIVPMSKIQIIGTRAELDATVRVLHDAGVVQIEEKPAAVDALILDARAAHQRDEITALVARLDALIAVLPEVALNQVACDDDVDALIGKVKTALAQLDAPAQQLAKRRDDLESDRVTLPRYAKTMRQLMPLAAELAPMQNYETVAILVDRKFSAVLEMVRAELPTLTNDEFEMVSREVDHDTTAALLVFPRGHSAAIHTLLGRESITQVRLPDELANVPFKEALATIQARLAAIPAEAEKIQHELHALARDWRARLVAWRAVLRDRLREIEVLEKFGATEYTFVVVGWMPQKNVAALRDALARVVGENVLMDELPITAHEREHAPVVLSNPRVARPFEFLVRLMALPRYGTIDPTPIMAIFLPIFFGMILGDVAYGALVLIGVIYFLRKTKSDGMRNLLVIILYCAIWSIAFGFVYGEFFGELGEQIGLHPFFPRGESVVPLFAFSIAFGVAQIALGFALGIYQAIKLRERNELLDRVAKVIALIAIFAMIAASSGALPREMFTPALALLIVGTVILMYTIGWIGLLLAPIEILGVVGNILSYLRLAAIGLSSVYLAMVANKLAGIFGNLIIGVIVAGLFHALNLALGILSPTIQSLRLHYVEFFGKFFQGGGVEFKPFRRERIET